MYRQSVFISTVVVCLLTAPAWGQHPATNDVSDSIGNTGSGTGALSKKASSPSGSGNTAVGFNALFDNTVGSANTAVGTEALTAGIAGSGNTAVGFRALAVGGGSFNVATGADALQNNRTGIGNTALGSSALRVSTTGSNNVATGQGALGRNTIGSRNTALGAGALISKKAGSRNIAIGADAGSALTSGSDNIYLGNNTGYTVENATLRLGDVQTSTYIAGVTGTPIANGRPVVINSLGQLGVRASSARYKQDIQPMGEQSARLAQLRPVTFSYKEDSTATRQYGLIAEEVAKVYPEMVIRNDAGTIEGVHYEALAPLLLNEVQQQKKTIAALAARLDRMEARAEDK